MLSYNAFNQVTSHILPSGVTVTTVYDGMGLKQSESNSAYPGEVTYFTYYSPTDQPLWTGRLKEIKTPLSVAKGVPFAVKFEYSGRGQVTKIHYAATGQGADPSVTYAYDSYGNCTSITDELGHTKGYVYDSYRRCTSYTELLNAPDWRGQGNVASRTWEWVYDRFYGANGYPAVSHTGSQWRLHIEPVINAAGDRKMTVQYFDNNDRVWAVQTGWLKTAAGAWVFGADGETHYFGYDGNGNKTSYTDPLNRVTGYTFDNRNRQITVTDPLNQTTTTAYDYSNNKTRVTFPDTRFQQWFNYDAFGQAWSFIDERNNWTALGFQWGPMKKTQYVVTYRDKDAGGTEEQWTLFYYDGLGRETRRIFPNNTDEVNTYQNNTLISWRNRNLVTKSFVYDARGRETSHTWSDGGVTPGITRVWDDASRLTEIANSVSTIGYTYDDAGQVRTETNTIAGAAAAQTSFWRFPIGWDSTIQYPGTHKALRQYNARGQLASVAVSDITGGWNMPLASYSYFPDGKPNVITHGNNLTTAHAYDGKGNLQSLNLAAGSSPRLYRYYWRDNRDRIYAWVKGTVAGNSQENGRGDRYIYDAEGQLTDAYYDAQSPSGAYTAWQREDHFVLDALGNRKSIDWLASAPGWYAWTRRDNGLNQINIWAGARPANWDDNWGLKNGNLIQDGYFSAWYNALNQPIWYQGPTTPSGSLGYLGYDPLGRCVKRWVGPSGAMTSNPATYLYYHGWNLIQEGNGGGNGVAAVVRYFFHGDRVDEIVSSWRQTGNVWLFHHYDARTHCVALTNSGQAIVEQYAYDAFGKTYFYDGSGSLTYVNGKNDSPLGNRFLFTGREWISDWGVYDYRHRHYHPELGRFVQPDPKHFAANDYNLYRYCHNDPINNTDPTGLDLRIDKFQPDEVRAAIQAIIDRVSQTAEGAAAIQAMRDSKFDNVILGALSGTGTSSTVPRDGANMDNNVGSGAIMTIPLSATTNVRSDGTIEVLPASVTAGHEFGHGASINSGTQPPADPAAKGADYIKQPSESKSDSVRVENAVRKLEKLKDRD